MKRSTARCSAIWTGADSMIDFSALRALVDGLTPREREVFGLLVRGKLNKQIAYELGTSERTIKAHRHSIMNKLNVSSFAEAVTIAERLGILTGL